MIQLYHNLIYFLKGSLGLSGEQICVSGVRMISWETCWSPEENWWNSKMAIEKNNRRGELQVIIFK